MSVGCYREYLGNLLRSQSIQDEDLGGILLDYIRFEKRFRDGYKLSAAQIYCSGLAFAPRESVISKLYHSRFHIPVTASGNIDKLWPLSEPLVIIGKWQVWSVAFSPDGKQIVSGSNDQTIRVWNVATGEQCGEALRGHDSSVTSVAFSPDGKQIVSGSDDQTIRVWNVATGEQCGEALRGHDD